MADPTPKNPRPDFFTAAKSLDTVAKGLLAGAYVRTKVEVPTEYSDTATIEIYISAKLDA